MSTAVATETLTDIKEDLSFSEYHAIAAVSHSVLEGFVPPLTPAHGRERMIHPKDPTDALVFGHALHVCILEPERYELEYIVAPKLDRRTSIGKATWANFEESNKGKTVLAADEDAHCRSIRSAVLAHPTARELMVGAVARELSIVWKDKEIGAACKARLDLVTALAGFAFIGDLKSTQNAGERSFQKDIATYGYARQGAWYREGLNVLQPYPRRFVLIAVEKDPPYCVACYEVDERALEQGERENRTALELFVRCQESGVYPGYDAGLGLVDLPSWAVDKLDLD